MKKYFALRLPISFLSLQLGLVAGGVISCWLKCCRGRGRIYAREGGGQLPKFGAVEEKVGEDFTGCEAIKEFLDRIDLSMLCAVFLPDSK